MTHADKTETIMFLRRNPLKRISNTLKFSLNGGFMGFMAKAQLLPPRVGTHSIFKRDIKVVSHHIVTRPNKEVPLSAAQQYERICNMYSKLNEQVNGAVERARAHNKKILITIGEDHGDRRSLIIHLLIINLILRNKLAKKLMVEAPQSFLEILKNEKPGEKKYVNLQYLLQIAEQDGFTIIPVDPSPFDDNEKRHQGFKESALALNDDVMFVTGVNHLSFLHEDAQIQEKFESLAINAANIDPGMLMLQMIFSSFDFSEVFKVLEDNSPYIKADLPSDCLRMDIEKLLDICKEMRLQDPNVTRMQAIDEPACTSGISVRKLK
jgi:hypothetical protein